MTGARGAVLLSGRQGVSHDALSPGRLSQLPRVDREALIQACRRLTSEETHEAIESRVLPISWSPYAQSYVAADERGFAAARAAGRTVVARADPQDLADALQNVYGEGICDAAVNRLARMFPDFSARRRATGRQWLAITLAAAAFSALALTVPAAAVWTASVIFSLLFLSVAGLWLLCLMPPKGRKRNPPPPDLSDDELPIYTVLVPLYRETEVLDQLCVSLRAIDYPAFGSKSRRPVRPPGTLSCRSGLV